MSRICRHYEWNLRIDVTPTGILVQCRDCGGTVWYSNAPDTTGIQGLSHLYRRFLVDVTKSDPTRATLRPKQALPGVVASHRGSGSAAFDLGPIAAINAEPPAGETQESTRL